MKVGILTFHHTTNYGATLQAYGLFETIRRQGHEVEIINYQPYQAIKFYRDKVIQPIKANSRREFVRNFLTYSPLSLIRHLKMRLFLVSKMKLSSRKIHTLEELKTFFKSQSKYDAVVCGSDQIWCINSIRGFDPSYFLDFVDRNSKCRRISYAASFGPTIKLGEHRNSITELFDQFHAIAVRDSNSLRLVQEECKKIAQKVLDPTFLIDFSEVTNKFIKPSKRYLLLYLENYVSAEEVRFIESIALKQNLEIISVGQPYKNLGKNLMSVGPDEWLAYYKHASYVVTNLYHGTIFSIKFRKPFTTLARDSKMNKTGDLLGDLGLHKRFLMQIEQNSINEQLESIDYDAVFEKLHLELSKSRDYLFNTLGSDESISVLTSRRDEIYFGDI